MSLTPAAGGVVEPLLQMKQGQSPQELSAGTMGGRNPAALSPGRGCLVASAELARKLFSSLWDLVYSSTLQNSFAVGLTAPLFPEQLLS